MRVLAVSGDAGGAQCVHSVCVELRKRGAHLSALAYGPAVRIFGDGACPLPEQATTVEQAGDQLTSFQADALLLGTSINDREDEKTFLQAARSLGIPSLAVLDFWSNYHGRFATRPEPAPMDAVPDCLAVMDETARFDLEALGIPASVIAVTGQPAFDRLHESPPSIEACIELRRAIGCRPEERLVLFASQPFRELTAQTGMAPVPYDEVELARMVLAASRDLKARLWIRPHPRELPDKYEMLTNEGAILSKEGDSRHALHAADAIVGMSTVFLLEAAIIGKPVLSLQPGIQGEGPLPLRRLKLATLFTREVSLQSVRAWLATANCGSAPNPAPALATSLRPGAAIRVIIEIERLVTRRRNR